MSPTIRLASRSTSKWVKVNVRRENCDLSKCFGVMAWSAAIRSTLQRYYKRPDLDPTAATPSFIAFEGTRARVTYEGVSATATVQN